MSEPSKRPGRKRESVWDYPRPPKVETCDRLVEVMFNGETVATTRAAKRILETSHPPVYYIPPEDVRTDLLVPSERMSWCEFKGRARYFDVRVGNAEASSAAWSYSDPAPGYEVIRNHLAFYPRAMEACLVDGERVRAQPGDFYGGWITRDLEGPFKGGPGTGGW